MQRKRKFIQNEHQKDDVPWDENDKSILRSQSPKKKLKKKHLFRPPTNEELIQYKETETLFNSNIFRLQIEEILKEVSVKPKYCRRITDWVEQFNKFLKKIPAHKEIEITDQSWLEQAGVRLPLNQEPFDSKGFFHFQTCGKAEIVGSFNLNTSVGPNFNVDLKITTPQNFFIKNDSINHRYNRKRAMYLSYITLKLKDSKLIEHLSFKFLNGNEFKPVLVIKPTYPLSKRITFILHTVCHEDDFKLTRFAPLRNNIRENWFFSKRKDENSEGPPTPYYNASIMHDLTSKDNQETLVCYLTESKNLLQAIVLLKIWSRQRKLDQFSGFIISMLVVYLTKNKIINPAMSSYQIVRSAWAFIGNSDWSKNGISLAATQIAINRPSITDFHKYFAVVFVDSTGFHNCCYDLSLNVYTSLKNESILAIKLLDDSNSNGFVPLFLTRFNFYLQFDHILRICDERIIDKSISSLDSNELQIDYGIESHKLRVRFLSDILRKGLGKRLLLLSELPTEEESVTWQINEDCHKFLRGKRAVVLGLKLNPEEAYELLDKGPPANELEAAEFRKFWGEKSELRRFQDGSINETCVWRDNATKSQCRLIVKDITLYILKTKLGIESNILYIADQLDNVLRPKKFKGTTDFADFEENTTKALETFEALKNEIIALNDLPLYINSIQGTSSLFSYSEPTPPLGAPFVNKVNIVLNGKSNQIRETNINKSLKKQTYERPVPCPKYVPETRAVIELGASGKWPGDLDAFRRLKAAFHIQISAALTEQCGLVTHAYPDHLKILKNGYVLSLELSHQKEIGLIKRYIDNTGVLRHKETDESLEKEHTLVQLPKLRSALHGLYKRNSCFGVTCLLVKRWLSAHMIDNYLFPHLVIDLVVASLFLHPEPYQEAVQPQVAFLRFLDLMITTDWNKQPLFVNFNNDLTKEAITQFESNFNSARDSFPKVFIVTPYEGTRISYWSRRAPNVHILNRVIQLATDVKEILIHHLYIGAIDVNAECIFQAGTGYNALINLKDEYIPTRHYFVLSDLKQIYKPPSYTNSINTIPVVNFDPVQLYLKELREAYGDYALFFHDMYGGNKIGVLFRPESLEPKEFKISGVNGRKAVNGHLELNIRSIIEDFKIIGNGIVDTIHVNYDSYPLCKE